MKKKIFIFLILLSVLVILFLTTNLYLIFLKPLNVGIDIDKKYEADPWIIALALEMMTDPQKKLFTIKRIVVTEEKLRRNKVRIPLICKNKTIESIEIISLFRIEGWKF